MNFKSNILTTLLTTPRGLAYSAMTIIILISLITGSELIKWISIAFLAYSLASFAIENFACIKCGLGLIASISIVLVAFEIFIFSPRFYVLTFILMWADAWVHAAG